MTFISNLIQRRPYLVTTIAYLITVAISRLVVKAIEMKLNIPFLGYDVIGEYHIHHFAYGIILISLIVFYILYNKTPRWIKYIHLLYGISLGLIFDEFGIWIKLDPSYHQLASTLAIIFIGTILGIFAVIESRSLIEKNDTK